MDTAISQQRQRAIKALSLSIESWSLENYTKHDNLLDNIIRDVYSLPPRPINAVPYIGWQGNNSEDISKGFNSIEFAKLVEKEASRKLPWTPKSEATKYTNPFIKVGFRGRFAWCSAFVRWCLIEHGVSVPLICNEYPGYTYALAECFQKMGQAKNWYYDNDGKFIPQAGDIVLFDWSQKSIHEIDMDWEDHIGIFLEPLNNNYFACAEGNCRNRSGVFKRNYCAVQGYVRIPNGVTAI